MYDRTSAGRDGPFTNDEFAALQALRVRRQQGAHGFTEPQLAHLRLLRWLVRQPMWRRTVREPGPEPQGTVPTAPTTRTPTPPTGDAWMHRLKAAYNAGYYRTEPAADAQLSFPWQHRTCKDCPFWSAGICTVLADYRWSHAHTCAFFDPGHRMEAQRLVQQQRWQGFRRWWEWLNE